MSLLIGHVYRFGEFTIDTDQGILLREGKPLPLAPKVFDTLLVLVEFSGRIVAKEELMNRLWPDTFVEESNLTFNIQQLRKTLGDNARKPVYIETIARRGYRFIADVEDVLSDRAAPDVSLTQRVDTYGRQSPPADSAPKTGTKDRQSQFEEPATPKLRTTPRRVASLRADEAVSRVSNKKLMG